MGVALGPAGAEREPELGASQMAGDPGHVGVGQRKIALARTLAHDQLQRARRPHLAGLARLVGDQHDLEPPPLGGLGDVSRAARPPRRFRPAPPPGRPRRAARPRFRDRTRSGSARWRARWPARRRRSARRRTTASGRATVTGCALAMRAAATRPGITPFSEGPAIRPISSPRVELAADARAEQAALRALARNSRSRWVWMTLIRIRGNCAASSSRSDASSSSVSVIVLADTVAVRSAPVIASWAPITSPLRIRSSISPPPAVVPAVQITRPPVISQMRSLASPAAHSCSPGANWRGRMRAATTSSSSSGQSLEQAAAAERGVSGHLARFRRKSFPAGA